jgi:SAM-dependent methyltransferase
MIERHSWSAIAHAGLPFMGPYGVDHLERALAALPLPDQPRVVDLGCGNGAVLEHLARTRGATGIGIDLEPVAREIEGITFVQGDAGAYQTTTPFDLALSIGSVGTPPVLAKLVRPGGSVLWGEGYWQRPPDPAFLEALGAGSDELDTLDGMVARGRAAWLVSHEPVTSSPADWDAYEDAWADNGEQFAASHAGEEGVQEFLDWIRAGRRRYREQGGRETLGFALMPFSRPG